MTKNVCDCNLDDWSMINTYGMEYVIWEYVRKRKPKKNLDNKNKPRNNPKVGILLAGIYKKKVVIGYSLCCRPWFKERNCESRPHDQFNIIKGIQIAFDRAVKKPGRKEENDIPGTIERALPKFIERCNRYYKGKPYPKWVKNILEEIKNKNN